MKTLIYSLVVAGVVLSAGLAYADHDKACKNVHGKVAIVTDDGITVNDKLYIVGETTRIVKNEKRAKLADISTGDMVCVDARGKDDPGREVASVTVLGLSDSVPSREKEFVREKVVLEPVPHEKTCSHIHGRVTSVKESTLIVDGKPYVMRETTRFQRSGHTVKIETIKAGDFVCMDAGDEKDAQHSISSVVLLTPSEAAPFQRQVIRERERVREQIREEKDK